MSFMQQDQVQRKQASRFDRLINLQKYLLGNQLSCLEVFNKLTKQVDSLSASSNPDSYNRLPISETQRDRFREQVASYAKNHETLHELMRNVNENLVFYFEQYETTRGEKEAFQKQLYVFFIRCYTKSRNKLSTPQSTKVSQTIEAFHFNYNCNVQFLTDFYKQLQVYVSPFKKKLVVLVEQNSIQDGQVIQKLTTFLSKNIFVQEVALMFYMSVVRFKDTLQRLQLYQDLCPLHNPSYLYEAHQPLKPNDCDLYKLFVKMKSTNKSIQQTLNEFRRKCHVFQESKGQQLQVVPDLSLSQLQKNYQQCYLDNQPSSRTRLQLLKLPPKPVNISVKVSKRSKYKMKPIQQTESVYKQNESKETLQPVQLQQMKSQTKLNLQQILERNKCEKIQKQFMFLQNIQNNHKILNVSKFDQQLHCVFTSSNYNYNSEDFRNQPHPISKVTLSKNNKSYHQINLLNKIPFASSKKKLSSNKLKQHKNCFTESTIVQNKSNNKLNNFISQTIIQKEQSPLLKDIEIERKTEAITSSQALKKAKQSIQQMIIEKQQCKQEALNVERWQQKEQKEQKEVREVREGEERHQESTWENKGMKTNTANAKSQKGLDQHSFRQVMKHNWRIHNINNKHKNNQNDKKTLSIGINLDSYKQSVNTQPLSKSIAKACSSQLNTDFQ